MGCKTCIKTVSGLYPRTGQAKIHADLPRASWQEIATANIGEKPNSGFRHCKQGPLSRHPEHAVYRNTDPAAHRDTIHQGDIGFGIIGDVMIKVIFAPVKGIKQIFVIILARIIKTANIAAGTKGLFTGTFDHNGLDRRIGFP